MALIGDLLSVVDGELVVDAEWVAGYVNRTQHGEKPGHRYRAHEALRLALRIVCERRAPGADCVGPGDFHETDRPLVEWWARVQSGELQTPRKVRGADPRVKLPEDVLIRWMLEALQAEGITGTKNVEAAHERESGSELIARHWGPKTRKVLKSGGVASVVQGFSGIRRPRKR